MSEAFVTLVTNDQYALGALVLAHSLKETHTSRSLVCMTTNSLAPALRYPPSPMPDPVSWGID